ncbi:PHP domain-containing protein [Candidatus Parvarchaeota archaeon]|nr:PHP domain-containing protein [Candidatus Parvarchaeota archaeon]
MKIDFHVHSNHSVDALDTVESLALAARKKGLDAIAVCDHDTMARKGGRPQLIGGVLVLFGTEVSTAQGHVQVFGTGKTYKKGIDAFKLVEKVKSEGGITIVAHPYSRRGHALHELAPQVGATALEKFNGRDFVHSWRARRLIAVGTGGSDAHVAAEVGNAWTEIETIKPSHKNLASAEADILSAVAKGQITARYRPSLASIASRYAQKLGRFIRTGKVGMYAPPNKG